MARFTYSDCRWSGLDSDWPSVGSRLCEFPSPLPVFDRYGSSSSLGHFHTFVDDWRLESIWRHPHLQAHRVIDTVCVAPDYSVFWGDPLPFVTWQCWRSRVVSWAWSRAGALVIPAIQFGNVSSFPISVSGVRPGSVLAVRGPSCHDDMDRWISGCTYWKNVIHPDLVIQFGRSAGSELWSNVLLRPLRPSPLGKG